MYLLRYLVKRNNFFAPHSKIKFTNKINKIYLENISLGACIVPKLLIKKYLSYNRTYTQELKMCVKRFTETNGVFDSSHNGVTVTQLLRQL